LAAGWRARVRFGRLANVEPNLTQKPLVAQPQRGM
jgi:hypothetical protein